MARRGARVAGIVALAIVGLVLTGVRRDRSVEDLRRTYANAASRFVAIEGMQVHYRDEGSGPPLVLIHGTSSSLHTWDAWTAKLVSHRRVIRLDLPGFGLTGPAPDRDYRAARHARVVRTLLDRLGVVKADLVGNSLGGRVATTFTLAYPERVRKLVLVDAAGLSGQKPPKIFRLARTPVVNRILLYVTPAFLVRKNVEEVYGVDSRITDAVVERYQALLLREGNRGAVIDRFTRAKDPNLDARLGEIRAPTLIEWGARDPWIPLPFGERYHAGIRGSRLVVYSDAGHVPMEEIPEATVRDADAFLSE